MLQCLNSIAPLLLFGSSVSRKRFSSALFGCSPSSSRSSMSKYFATIVWFSANVQSVPFLLSVGIAQPSRLDLFTQAPSSQNSRSSRQVISRLAQHLHGADDVINGGK